MGKLLDERIDAAVSRRLKGAGVSDKRNPAPGSMREEVRDLRAENEQLKKRLEAKGNPRPGTLREQVEQLQAENEELVGVIEEYEEKFDSIMAELPEESALDEEEEEQSGE